MKIIIKKYEKEEEPTYKNVMVFVLLIMIATILFGLIIL